MAGTGFEVFVRLLLRLDVAFCIVLALVDESVNDFGRSLKLYCFTGVVFIKGLKEGLVLVLFPKSEFGAGEAVALAPKRPPDAPLVFVDDPKSDGLAGVDAVLLPKRPPV